MGLLIHVAGGEEPALCAPPLGTSWVVALLQVVPWGHFCPPCVFQMSCGNPCPARRSCLP